MPVDFLLHAGLLLGGLAAAAWLFLGLRQSVIPAFILVGIALRPWVADTGLVELFATLGVILLLFLMGMQFSLSALLRDHRAVIRTGSIDLLVCFPVGLVAGLVLGLGWTGALLLAGGFYVSSSAIVAKSIIELRRAADPETSVALGILVFEDLFLAGFLAVLSGAVLTSDPSLSAVGWGIARALFFFGVVVLVALRGRSLLERLFDRENDDLFLLLVASLVLLLAWTAHAAGLSEVIGAFLAGLIIAETAQRDRAEGLFAPLQGIFAAIFFLGFGLSLDVESFGRVWPAAIVLAFLAIATKLTAGWWAGKRCGLSDRSSLALGLTLIPHGEFSIILAGIAVAVGLKEAGALLALLILILSIVGTASIRFSPQLTRWIFQRGAEASLIERGFSPELAAEESGRASFSRPNEG